MTEAMMEVKPKPAVDANPAAPAAAKTDAPKK
jgi:hypothetical protein